MILNLGSLSFNADIQSGGGTPAWGTELGQGSGYKFTFEDMSDFFTGMVYSSVSNINDVTCPLGKGGNQQSDYDFVIASHFKKIFVNGIHVDDAEFILLVVKKLVGEHHVGRRTIKYNPKMTYKGREINDDCYKLIIQTLGYSLDASWFINEINIKNQDELHFVAYILGDSPISYSSTEERKQAYLSKIPHSNNGQKFYVTDSIFKDFPLQQIFYGAPGTGKSNTIKREVEDKGRIHFRTTFHPDSDYSTFVGCYKPTMVEAPVRDGSGHEVKEAKQEEKNRISYSFVPQAFAKAYCEAWNKYGASENAEPVFLIIEEINRGNCAQIFGDIFQLIDREMDGDRCGFSTYPIDADEDLKAFLEYGTKKDGSQWLTNKEGIKDGKLCLPPNLHIWATMNTSDQSLFPIDSAFKRRWDWKYVPIDTKKENWTIKTASNEYSWSSFLEKINEEIDSATRSEDKMLGFYFCRANNGVIDADKFVSKVLFYLYNDVFKDYGLDRELFKDEEGKVISFKSYYNTDGTINESVVLKFLDNLKVEETGNKSATSEAAQIEDKV